MNVFKTYTSSPFIEELNENHRPLTFHEKNDKENMGNEMLP